jgi:hypothetical protein
MGDDVKFVRECWTPTCFLHSFRMGRNPARIGKGGAGKRFVSAERTAQNQIFQVG